MNCAEFKYTEVCAYSVHSHCSIVHQFLLPLTHTYIWSPYLPHYWFHVISCGGQADTQHNGVRGGGQDTGDDGVPHRERQHGVNHKHNEQEEWHLWRKRHTYDTPAEESGKERMKKRAREMDAQENTDGNNVDSPEGKERAWPTESGKTPTLLAKVRFIYVQLHQEDQIYKEYKNYACSGR